MPKWDSSQYLKFQNERTQPALDLAMRIPLQDPRRVIDLGCGPGNSTAVLQGRFPGAAVTGVDSSPDMIAAAQKNLPGTTFIGLDLGGDLSPLGTGYDVVFSNACIQWIPGHRALLARWMGLLSSGGVLAVQTPMNQGAPIYAIIQKTVQGDRWRGYISEPELSNNLRPEEYYDLLGGLASGFSLWETNYYHVMDSHRAILEWFKGTGLRPFLEAIPVELHQDFEDELLTQIALAYPPREDGRVIFRFNRFFMIASK